MGKSVEDILGESIGVSWHEYLSADRSPDEKALYLDSMALVAGIGGRTATEDQTRYVNALGDYAGVSGAGKRVAELCADASKIRAKEVLKMLSDRNVLRCWIVDAAFVASLDPQQDAATAVGKVCGAIGPAAGDCSDYIKAAVTVATGDVDEQMIDLFCAMERGMSGAWRTIVEYRRLLFDSLVEQLSLEFSELGLDLSMVQLEMTTKSMDVFNGDLEMVEGFARKLGGIQHRIVKSELEEVKKKYEDIYDKCRPRIDLAKSLFSLFGLEYDPYVNSAYSIEFDEDSSSDNDNWSKNNEMALNDLTQLGDGLEAALDKADKLFDKVVRMSCCPPPAPDMNGVMLEWSEISGMPFRSDKVSSIVAALDKWFVRDDSGAVYSSADGKEWTAENDVPEGKLVSAGGLLFAIGWEETYVKEAASAPWRQLVLPETEASLNGILHVCGKWFLYYENYEEYQYVKRGVIIDDHETGYATHGCLFMADKLDGNWSAGPDLPEAAALDCSSGGVALCCLENQLVGKLTFDYSYKNDTGKKYLRDTVCVAGDDGFECDYDSNYSIDPLPDSGHLFPRKEFLMYVTDHAVHRSDNGLTWQRVEGAGGVSIGSALFLADGNVVTFEYFGDDCNVIGVDGSIRHCGNNLNVSSAAVNGNLILAATPNKLFVGTLKVRDI